MTPPLEKKLERDARQWAWTHYQLRSTKLQLRNDAGWPDTIFWLPGGKPLLVEFKREGQTPRALQVHRHEILQALGYTVAVIDTLDSFRLRLRTALEAVEAAQGAEAGDKVLT